MDYKLIDNLTKTKHEGINDVKNNKDLNQNQMASMCIAISHSLQYKNQLICVIGNVIIDMEYDFERIYCTITIYENEYIIRKNLYHNRLNNNDDLFNYKKCYNINITNYNSNICVYIYKYNDYEKIKHELIDTEHKLIKINKKFNKICFYGFSSFDLIKQYLRCLNSDFNDLYYEKIIKIFL